MSCLRHEHKKRNEIDIHGNDNVRAAVDLARLPQHIVWFDNTLTWTLLRSYQACLLYFFPGATRGSL